MDYYESKISFKNVTKTCVLTFQYGLETCLLNGGET